MPQGGIFLPVLHVGFTKWNNLGFYNTRYISDSQSILKSSISILSTNLSTEIYGVF